MGWRKLIGVAAALVVTAGHSAIEAHAMAVVHTVAAAHRVAAAQSVGAARGVATSCGRSSSGDLDLGGQQRPLALDASGGNGRPGDKRAGGVGGGCVRAGAITSARRLGGERGQPAIARGARRAGAQVAGAEDVLAAVDESVASVERCAFRSLI